MWSWLRTLLLKWLNAPATPPAEPTSPASLWNPTERLILRYFDGEKLVARDPMAVYRKVKDVQQEIEKADLVLARSNAKNALDGYKNAARKIRGAFDLKPFEEGGITEVECLELYNTFMSWVGDQKKTTPNPTTTSEATSTPTETTSSEGSADTPPTANGSAGGSTASEASTPTPTPSPSA